MNTVNAFDFSRRTFLGLAAGAWASPWLPAATPQRRRRFSWTLELPAETAATLPPPGVELDGPPTLRLDVETVVPESANILEPGEWAWARLLVRSRAGETAGWTPLWLYASNERALRVARERDGMPAAPAQITLVEKDGELTATVTAGGAKLLELTATLDSDAAELSDPGKLLIWTGQPAADWRTEGGALNGAVIRAATTPANPAQGRSCSSVESSWARATTVSAWYGEPAEAGEPQARPVRTISSAQAGPGFPHSYPTRREALEPARLGDAALAAMPDREELLLGPLEACEIDVMVPQEAHAAMLPPMFRSGGRPMLKLLGLRVHESQLSPEPFQEVWLFAFGIVAGRAGWLAVSHITEPQGDAIYGREAFGYPTKLGSPDIVATPLDFQVTINRLGREVAYARGMFKGFATGTSLGQLPMMSLRAKRGGESAEILYQPWTFQGRRSRVDPATLEVSFPAAKAPGMELLSDPWSELNPLRPLAVSAMDGAAMQRGPAEVLLEWNEFGAYYRERCDGVLPWEAAPVDPPQPTLLAGGPDAQPRS